MSKYWKIPPDQNAKFVAAMEDILEVYARPYDANFPVARTSLYHFLFELHNGRFLRDLIGSWYILYVPLVGMVLMLFCLTGAYDWLKRKMSRLRKKNVVDHFSIHNIAFLENGPYNLELSAGECCGLTGKSGVGKSQLLRAIADVIVHEGECLLGDTPALAFSPQNWRKSVAMVPAESFWWYDRVGSHFRPDKSDDALLMHLVTQLGFNADIFDWQVSRLSTGERQRLSLVRTLVMKPQILLLDEPTSGLDQKMAAVVEEIVTEMCAAGQCSCLWVSHDSAQLARVANRIFQVEGKGLVELLL